jgi:hypothetical protein
MFLDDSADTEDPEDRADAGEEIPVEPISDQGGDDDQARRQPEWQVAQPAARQESIEEWKARTEMVECRVKGIQFMSRTSCEARKERLIYWTGLRANAERQVCRGCTNGAGVGPDPPWRIQEKGIHRRDAEDAEMEL